jgi:3-hydroxyisobutyrate dehydrogenase
MARIAFIGLGIMGAPMARHLAAAGHELTVVNRTPAKAQAWVEAHGGRMSAHPQEAAEGADAVITCVGTDDDVAQVTLGRDGAFRSMAKGALFIDHSTISARLARQLSVEGDSRGLLVVDAPVTGSQPGAETGTLTIMCGGRKRAIEAATPIMEAYSRRIVHIGGAGTGQTAKMANQIALAAVVEGVAEALRFAQSARLDTDKVYEAISGGAAASWQMDNHWHAMARDDFAGGFPVDWMRKDVGLAIEEARANGASLPVAAMIDQFCAEIQAMGAGRQDTSALVRRLPK